MAEESMTTQVVLPKNIRQMGTPGEKQKVYVEDYVHTYLHTFLKEKYKDDTLRAALLLGEFVKQDGTTYAFIKGAFSCDFSQLHENISAELSLAVATHFPDWEVMGWYVSALGEERYIQSEIKHSYAGEGEAVPRYLIFEDLLERETDVFAWEQGDLHKLTGYYIYYERNPQMQEFLIKEKGGRPQEEPAFRPEKPAVTTPVEVKPEVKKTARKEVKKDTQKERTRERKPQRIVYAACAAVLVLLAAMGVSQIGNYQNLQQLQEVISDRFLPVEEQTPAEEETPAEEQTPKEEQVSTEEQTPEEESVPSEESKAEGEFEPQEETVSAKQESVSPEVAEEETAPQYYTVKKGDSLYSISRTVYENEDMVDEICEVNGLTNIHLIYEGQNLKLP